jgi:futalosine hydrolase
MEKGNDEIIIAVAHPSEGGAVEKAMKAARFDCELLVTGVGGAAMSWALQKRFSSGATPSLVIGAGIAGSYSAPYVPGDVVIAQSDCFADMGVDDNGSFLSLFRASLADPDKPPFRGGWIHCHGRWFDRFVDGYPAVRAATVNMTSGSKPVIDRIRHAWDPDIETMEGAWFAYACEMSGAEWLAVRAISNMIEPRNLKKWDIPLALEKLQEAMTDILNTIKKG